MLSILRKIIGFIPALLPINLAWFIMSPMPATSEIYRTPLYRPADVPWYIWLWIAIAVVSGILLCTEKLIVPGLTSGALPYAVLMFIFYNEYDIELKLFLMSFILFYVIYGIIYYTYRHKLDRS